ncbi:Virulence sensor protein BvgS precursor [compost metagenome]
MESTVIIGLTADAQPEEIELCIQAGMIDCLIKPLGLDELDARLLALEPGYEADTPEFLHFLSEPLMLAPEALRLVDLGPLELLISSEPVKFRQILDELIQNNRKDCQALKTLLQQDDPDKLGQLAHRIKGAAKVVKGEQLVERCRQLEAACLSPQVSFAQLEQAVAQVEVAIIALEEALRNLQPPTPHSFVRDGS